MATLTVLGLWQTVTADPGGWDHMGGWGWSMAITGWVVMALLVTLVIWAIRGDRTVADHTRRSVEILADRYARGEIDRDEYLERRSDLEL